jgi:hypothetical protein
MKTNFIKNIIASIVKFHKTSYTSSEDKKAASYGTRPVMVYTDNQN